MATNRDVNEAELTEPGSLAASAAAFSPKLVSTVELREFPGRALLLLLLPGLLTLRPVSAVCGSGHSIG